MIFREQLEREFGLNVQDLYPDKSWWDFLQRFGRSLVKDDPDLCCFIRKVEPMQKGVLGVKAWITGIRRDQTPERAKARILEMQPDGLLKINPMLNWTAANIAVYMKENNLQSIP